jgi:hypothetical protein
LPTCWRRRRSISYWRPAGRSGWKSSPTSFAANTGSMCWSRRSILPRPDAASRLNSSPDARSVTIDILVNNAGYGLHGFSGHAYQAHLGHDPAQHHGDLVSRAEVCQRSLPWWSRDDACRGPAANLGVLRIRRRNSGRIPVRRSRLQQQLPATWRPSSRRCISAASASGKRPSIGTLSQPAAMRPARCRCPCANPAGRGRHGRDAGG